MKIEMGESLILSWLKHIKNCQLIQLNWTVSPEWSFQNKDIIAELMNKAWIGYNKLDNKYSVMI